MYRAGTRRVLAPAAPVDRQQRAVGCKAAAEREPRQENVEGQFYVDHTCIDCDTCRWMAPRFFDRVEDQSAVVRQPGDREGRLQAMQATLSCPTTLRCTESLSALYSPRGFAKFVPSLQCTCRFSIHMRERDSEEYQAAQAGMPIPVPECPGVYHCGYHSEASFGAASYLIVREGGNLMVDCPRFHPKLAKNIEALGGVSQIVLSHIDDICDHDKWAKHFKAPRLMHQTEVRPSIKDIEIQIEGTGPWNLRGETISEQELDGDVHTPGHTKGCICLWHAPTKALFTGDHFGISGWGEARPTIFPFVNRNGKERQVANVEKLLQFEWEHVLPGHGRRIHAANAEERQHAVDATKPDAGLVAA